jgi:hypothetical protein
MSGSFLAAMLDISEKKEGINGETVYTEAGVEDPRVALFTMLVRGLETNYISSMADMIWALGDEGMRDFALMAFHTRDVRGGKGERDLFITMFLAIAARNADMGKRLIPLISEYGCWVDLWKLWRAAKDMPQLQAAIIAHTTSTFHADCSSATPSLLAKWLPRERRKYSYLVDTLADSFFPDAAKKARRALYRKAISAINKQLKTVEINMCGGTWREITPAHVPGRNLKLHTKAFLNQKLKCGDELRRPDNADRMECRAHFLEFLQAIKAGKTVAKGANVVFPHEIVTSLLGLAQPADTEQIDMLEAQWASIRSATAALGGLGRAVPMCDFSGSMSGLPLYISYALGLLISEVNHPAFRDHILTFDSTPEWHSFKDVGSLYEKVQSIRGIGQGLSTDFYKAAMLILDRMVEARVPIGEEPEDLIVLTDMGWDAAWRPSGICTILDSDSDSDSVADPVWKSQIGLIRSRFAEESRRLWGTDVSGWKVPRIVVWNLRAAFKDFQAKASDEGVVMISGWSPAILKALQSVGVRAMTPYEGMRATLDDERYVPVAVAVAAART